jgi:hypothetical protein
MEQIKHRSEYFVSLWLADRMIEVVKDKKELAGKALDVVKEKYTKC